MHTLITPELIKQLLERLHRSNLYRYVALDQGQADSDLGERRVRSVIYPALLIIIGGEEIIDRTHNEDRARGEITLRILHDSGLYANAQAPERHIDSAIEPYRLLEESIGLMQASGCTYLGFSAGSTEGSITELYARFALRGSVSNQ